MHVDSYGNGAPLLLIHGWGMHGGMWGSVAERLSQRFRVLAVDLPGHGRSGRGDGRGQTAPFSLDGLVDELSAQFAEPLTVCGWSLGGQVALRWALRYPQQVLRLMMVASTPRFVRSDGWECALSEEVLEEFAASLQNNFAQTLRRFVSLQMRGGDNERETLALLRDRLFSRGEPDLAALQSGLEILRDCDLRCVLPQVTQAALVVAGERDMLIPRQATQYLASRLPNGRLATIRGAAHAPFLSHPDSFMEHVVEFLGDTRA